MRCRKVLRSLAVGSAVIVGAFTARWLSAQEVERSDARRDEAAAADEWTAPPDFRPANVRIAEFSEAIKTSIASAEEGGRAERATSLKTRLDALDKQRDDSFAAEKSDRAELHVLGLYEGDYILEKGHKRADGTRVRGVANVHVAHAAAPVVLALSSYEPVMWDVRVDKGVRLKKVIVSGYYGSDAAAPEGVPVVGARPADDEGHSWFVHDKRRAEYARAVAELRTATGLEISTFQGAYSPKMKEFVIGPKDEAWRDEYLLSRYAAIAQDATAETRAAMIERIDEIRFEAPLFAGGDRYGGEAMSFGVFSARGPLSEAVQPLPKKCGRVVRDVVSGDFYGIVNHGLARMSLGPKGGEGESFEPIPLAAGLPELSHPCGIALDTRRRRMLVATLGGVGHLYAYDIAKRSWSLLGELGNRDFCALAYDAKNDAILGFLADHGGGGINKVVKLNAKGGATGEISLVPPIFTGNDHGYGVDIFATVADEWLFVVVANEVNRAAGNLGTLTVVDAKSGRGLLSRTLRTQLGRVGVDLKSRDITTLQAEQERIQAEIDRLTQQAKSVEQRIDALKSSAPPGNEVPRPAQDE